MAEEYPDISVMEELVSKHMSTQKETEDGEIISPSYISLTYKERDSTLFKIMDGKVLVKEIHNNIAIPWGGNHKSAGYFVWVVSGDEENGYAGGFYGRDINPDEIKKTYDLMEFDLENLVSISHKAYKEKLNELEDGKDKFFKLSDNPAEIYIEEDTEIENKIPGSFLDSILAWSRYASDLEHIEYSEASISENIGTRRLVDSEGRKIKDTSYEGKISFGIDIRNKEGFIVTYSDSITLAKNTYPNYTLLQNKLNEILHYSELLKEASMPEEGEYPVILSGAASADLAHEAFAHRLSGEDVKDNSLNCMRNRMGKKILPDFLSVIDNPQLYGSPGSYKFDDEGVKSQGINYIENGVLKDMELDRESAHSFGKKSNGHARSGWISGFRNGKRKSLKPKPRVGNLQLISSNTVSDKELMEKLKQHCAENNKEYGIYVEKVAVGEDDGSSLTLYPSKSWKIFSDGRTEPITHFKVKGNPLEMLNNITVTGENYQKTDGHSIDYNGSGSIPTQSIAPSVFIPKVNIERSS
tara:strand:+ start:4531 stop:6108 length:1578 start_codon:yes stop_codon:yes gene_type:complete